MMLEEGWPALDDPCNWPKTEYERVVKCEYLLSSLVLTVLTLTASDFPILVLQTVGGWTKSSTTTMKVVVLQTTLSPGIQAGSTSISSPREEAHNIGLVGGPHANGRS